MKKILLSSILCGFLVTVSNADVRFGGHGSGSGSSSSSSSSGYSSGHSSGGGDSSSGYTQGSGSSDKGGSSSGSASGSGEGSASGDDHGKGQASGEGEGSGEGSSKGDDKSGGSADDSSSKGDHEKDKEKDKDKDSSKGDGESQDDSSGEGNSHGMFDGDKPQKPDMPGNGDDHDEDEDEDKDKGDGKHSDFGEHNPPKKPEFSHAKGSVSAAEIEWEDTTDNELGYKVFRDGELIKILPPNTTEFKDTHLEAGKTYVYEIVPFNEFGDGEAIKAEVTTENKDVSHVENHLKEHLEKMFDDKFDDDKLKEAMEKYQNGDALTKVYKEILLKKGDFSDEEFVKNLYEVLLDKELSEEELNSLIEKLKNAEMTREEMFYDVVSSEDFKNKMQEEGIDNAFSGDEDKQKEHLEKVSEFVKRFYTKLLERSPEEGGYNYWAEKLAEKDLSAKDIAKQFFNSEEFKSKNLSDEDFVKKAYEVIMGRDADQAGVDFWVSKLQEGMSRDEVIDSFLQAKEFQNLSENYDIEVSDKVKEFVERFYTKALKRPADPSGSDYWAKELKNSEKTAKEVARQFFNSEEFKSKNLTDEEFVETVYETLMGRGADDAGKDYWVNQLQNGVSREEMIDQFLASEEFKKFALEAGVLIDDFQAL